MNSSIPIRNRPARSRSRGMIGNFRHLPRPRSGTGARTGNTPQPERFAVSWTIDLFEKGSALAKADDRPHAARQCDVQVRRLRLLLLPQHPPRRHRYRPRYRFLHLELRQRHTQRRRKHRRPTRPVIRQCGRHRPRDPLHHVESRHLRRHPRRQPQHAAILRHVGRLTKTTFTSTSAHPPESPASQISPATSISTTSSTPKTTSSGATTRAKRSLSPTTTCGVPTSANQLSAALPVQVNSKVAFGSSNAAVPEPASAVLFTLAVAFALSHRRGWLGSMPERAPSAP